MTGAHRENTEFWTDKIQFMVTQINDTGQTISSGKQTRGQQSFDDIIHEIFTGQNRKQNIVQVLP